LPKVKMFSVRDMKLNTWSSPWFFLHAGQAERTLYELVNGGESMLSKHPKDFELYMIGEFDDTTAELSSIPPVHIMTALSALKAPQEALPFDRPRA